jgi:hypothetical protein
VARLICSNDGADHPPGDLSTTEIDLIEIMRLLRRTNPTSLNLKERVVRELMR